MITFHCDLTEVTRDGDEWRSFAVARKYACIGRLRIPLRLARRLVKMGLR